MNLRKIKIPKVSEFNFWREEVEEEQEEEEDETPVCLHIFPHTWEISFLKLKTLEYFVHLVPFNLKQTKTLF